MLCPFGGIIVGSHLGPMPYLITVFCFFFNTSNNVRYGFHFIEEALNLIRKWLVYSCKEGWEGPKCVS